MPLISKPNYNQIFASQAPEQDKPAVFNNYPGGWGVESRPNNGKPTIKGFNYLQQTSDLKDLWILQNGACLPYDESIEYAEGAPVLKDGVIQYKTANGFKSRDAVTVPTYSDAADGVDPVMGVASGAYFNVRSSSDDSYIDEYQNVGGVATPTGKSYPSSAALNNIPHNNLKDRDAAEAHPASAILDASGKTQQQINDFTREKTLDLLNFFTDAEILAYRGDYTSVDVADAWQRAVTEANTLNQKLAAFGRFRSASTLVLSCHADLSCMILESSATDIAIDVRANDYGYLNRKNIIIGDVVNLNKVSGDKWANTTATGVRTVNLNRCFFKFNRIKDFAVGLDEYAQDNKGSAYNHYVLGQFDNNKIQHMLGGENGTTTANSSWVNQNKHDGGSYAHLAAEGSNIPDCHHIYIRPRLFAVNGNTFNNPSFENNACDFHVVNGGRFNYINQARWEIQSGTPKVKYVCETGSASVANHGTRNEIIGGYEAAAIQFTYEGTGSAFNNVLDTQSRSYFAMDTASGGKRYSNRFSNSEAVFTIFEGTTKRLDAYEPNEWTFAFAANKVAGKRTGDEYSRVEIDSQSGYLRLGTGAVAQMAILYGSATEFFVNRSFMPTNTESQDIGKVSAKWKNIHLSGSVGFFGSAPPTTKRSIAGKKSPTTIAEQNAVIDSIVLALAAYGIVSDDRTT